MGNVYARIRTSVKAVLQKMVFTIDLHDKNGLANHAAACAYGSLLSMAPMLLLLTFFIFIIFKPSPQVIAALIGHIPFLSGIFDERWLNSDLFSGMNMGISGVISVLSILWAGRILAISVQRGLNIIFPSQKKRNPVTANLVTLVIAAAVPVFALVAMISSRLARRFYRLLDFLPEVSIPNIITSQSAEQISSIVLLGLVSFLVYLGIPVNAPRKSSAFQGALFCAIAYGCTAMLLGKILDMSRYDFLYGALGNIIVILIKIYFFFYFLFLGAQLAFVRDSFEVLFLSELRLLTITTEKKNWFFRLFYPIEGKLKKNLCHYKAGEIIISKGDTSDHIYYLCEGEAVMVIPSKDDLDVTAFKDATVSFDATAALDATAAFDATASLDAEVSGSVLGAGSFFGEMSYLLSEDRSATVKAKTDVSVLVLSPQVFEAILKYDSDFDRDIIERMSRRLKKTNEEIITLKQGN